MLLQFHWQWNYKNFIIFVIVLTLGIDELLQPGESFVIPQHKNPFAINLCSSHAGPNNSFSMWSSMCTYSTKAQRRPDGSLVNNALNMIATSSSSGEDKSSKMSENNTSVTASKRKLTSTATNKMINKKRGALQWNGTRSQIYKSATPVRKIANLNNGRSSPINSMPMPILGYDGDAIMDYYDRRPLEVGWRLNSLGIPMLGWFFGLLLDKAFGYDKKEIIQRKRGEELRNILIRSRSVALIKSGQAASLRPDLIKNKIWAEELGKLVDAVGAFPDYQAMNIMKKELSDVLPRLQEAKRVSIVANKRINNNSSGQKINPISLSSTNASIVKRPLKQRKKLSKLEKIVKSDPILNLFEFSNDNHAVASASIGQVYKARIRRGPLLEAVIGKKEAAKWGGRTVAIKIQRPDVAASASLDMYLIRRSAFWLSKVRGGGLPAIADQFGVNLFGELDYIREADNCERFRTLYNDWDDVVVPEACIPLTRKRVLIMEWIDGDKGPWDINDNGIEMVRVGLRCSVNQLLNTGLFHSDPHRGNLLRTPDHKLAFLDFGMMTYVSEEERYGLIGLAIGLQKKDLSLITENLLELGFLDDSTQLDLLVPRLRQALKQATGGTGKASNVNFAKLQAELDEISRENVLQFKTPPFFTTILRSLTILEGFALNVDSNFRLVRGSYPYVLAQLLSPEDDGQETPTALTNLLIRLLTVDGKGERIEWKELRDFLNLAQKASKKVDTQSNIDDQDNDKVQNSRQTIDLFYRFLTSKTGLFLKRPLVLEIAEAIDGMASTGEANLLRISNGLIRPFPGGNGPVNEKRMNEIRGVLDMVQSAMTVGSSNKNRDNIDILEQGSERMEAIMELLSGLIFTLSDERRREEIAPIILEIQSVIQLVAVEVLEIRGSRAMRNILGSVSA